MGPVHSAGCRIRSAGSVPANPAVRDFNHDGKDDIAVPNGGASTITVLYGNGLGAFTPVTTTLPGWTVNRLRDLGDVNEDGWSDLAATTSAPTQSLVLLTNNQAGNFTVGPALLTAPSGVGFAPPAVDMNGDGHVDIVVGAGQEGRMYILYGNGAGAFPTQTSVLVGTGLNQHEVIDLNGDHRPDIVGTHPSAVPGNIFTVLNVCGTSDTAELTVTQSGPTTTTAGQLVTYSVTVTNNGPMPATGVMLTDVPSAGLSFDSATIACTDQLSAVQCALPTIPSGGFDVGRHHPARLSRRRPLQPGDGDRATVRFQSERQHGGDADHRHRGAGDLRCHQHQ